MMKYKSLA